MKYSIAIVTGGNKGIGLGITKLLLKNNYKVITCGRSGFKDLEQIKGLDHIQGDITNYETHRNLVEKAINTYGKLDLYVNNVGISKWKPIEDINSEFLDTLFKTNIYSVFWGCKASQKYLQETNGSIINISSIAGKRGSKNNSGYVSTKFAMNGITQSLSKELGNKNIRVNAICPVLIRTNGLLKALSEKSAPGHKNVDSFLETFKETQTALNRLPSINEVAQMALFLASKNASAITGQCINVDCGVFPQ
tara:strand:- start:476 stop:1225 length:750 start_codon:yes stop_codon:yes gene_type:complete